MYQVLVSIQGMILGVTHPIYNEPGLGGFESHERPGGGDGGGRGRGISLDPKKKKFKGNR